MARLNETAQSTQPRWASGTASPNNPHAACEVKIARPCPSRRPTRLAINAPTRPPTDAIEKNTPIVPAGSRSARASSTMSIALRIPENRLKVPVDVAIARSRRLPNTNRRPALHNLPAEVYLRSELGSLLAFPDPPDEQRRAGEARRVHRDCHRSGQRLDHQARNGRSGYLA